jgi:flagellar biosynthesis protein FlhF
MIDQHDQAQEKRTVQSNNQQQRNQSGYGSAGLNKSVHSTRGIASQIKEGLDDFLSLGEREERNPRNMNSHSRDFNFDEEVESSHSVAQPVKNQQRDIRSTTNSQAPIPQAPVSPRREVTDEFYEKQKTKIDELEKKLFELSKSFERIHKKEPIGIYQLRTTLRSLDINETYIQSLIKKGLFELTDSDVENADIVFEFALREMMNTVSVAMPLFSATSTQNAPIITVFISEASCGQSSMVQKIGAIKKDSIIIKNSQSTINPKTELKTPFAEKVFGLNVIKTNTIAEIVSECRKSLENGKSVFIDYKCNETESNETKKFIDGLRRAFSKVEVLITLSAIHSELYNRKVLGSYRRLSDGVVVSHLDACLNFGSLFNITQDIKDLPYKFFGTGEICPDDLEIATAERLMAGIFKLN